MKEYKVTIEEHGRYCTSSAGEAVSELGLVLQIYQDLKKLDSSAEEDVLIQKILMQILLEHFNDEESIPIPQEYRDKDEKTDYYEQN
jgi:hypothetical protein